MPYNFGQLKADCNVLLWPAGQASNLIKAHDAMFVDAIVDLQICVECLQVDNTDLFPQCSTLYNCGLTVFDAPRGHIKKLSVIDKIDPVTGLESATVPDDYCSEIDYEQVDFCHVRRFLDSSMRRGCCGSIPFWFGLDPNSCSKANYPVPTDVGVPAGLPVLPLGYHYAQSSTDSLDGASVGVRARAGVWAIERGKIYIAPWIQTTETVLVKWDGIKRSWGDADLIDMDPLLRLAVEEYVRWKHAAKFDHDDDEAARAQAAYEDARAKLWHECREETRMRGCEPSLARSSSITNLYYNDTAQSSTATCPDGTTGSPVTVTIPAGSVGSPTSVDDANQRAKDQAQSQAQAQLSCITVTPQFGNDPTSATVCCTSDTDHPNPDGGCNSYTVPADTVFGTSKADANSKALALAQQTAAQGLTCTYWNKSVSYTATCPSPKVGTPVTKTTAAHAFNSTANQAAADALATNDAKARAEAAIVCSGGPGFFWNTKQAAIVTMKNCLNNPECGVTVITQIPANRVSSLISQADANQQAINLAQYYATTWANLYCGRGACGGYAQDIP